MSPVRSALAAIPLVLFSGRPALAQNPVTHCDSTALRDSASLVKRILVAKLSREGEAPLPRPYADSLLARIANGLTLPTPVQFRIFQAVSYAPQDSFEVGPTGWAYPTPAINVRVVIEASGMFRAMRPRRMSFDDRVDSAFLSAIEQAFINDSDVPLKPPGLGARDSLVVIASLDIAPPPLAGDALRKKLERDRRHPASFISVAVGRVELPHYRVSRPPHTRAGSPIPRYPESMKNMGESGSVLISLVYAASGRPVPGTVIVEHATRSEFADAVRAALPGFAIEPAMIGGCPVPMLDYQPFEFSIAK